MSESRKAATTIVSVLRAAGYQAFFAGGWVRDYLMGNFSADIDIATDAPPEKIMALFPNTQLVGLAFGVVIVNLAGIQFEVATFRKDLEYLNGRTPLGIEFATPIEDASRRDFTINGMFYDPMEETLHDYTMGQQDIKGRIIRTIGDPHERFNEDRLRMIRAIRFAARLDFSIHPETELAIIQNAERLLPAVSMERIWQEFTKISKDGNFNYALAYMHKVGLLQTIFNELKHVSHHQILERITPLQALPKSTPTIAYIVQLFQDTNENEIESICRYLKASNEDVKLAKFLISSRRLLDNFETTQFIEWAKFYAHPYSQLALEIEGLRHQEREKYFEEHRKRIALLHPHIERIQKQNPLITSQDLINENIPPGKLMGILLKEAERIAINNHLHTREEVLKELKLSHNWPHKNGESS